jgi:hypothetical protein
MVAVWNIDEEEKEEVLSNNMGNNTQYCGIPQ